MAIWIIALILLGGLGLALVLASVAPWVRRPRGTAAAAADEPLFFQLHRPPERPEIGPDRLKNP
jgi:hypothetical protein